MAWWDVVKKTTNLREPMCVYKQLSLLEASTKKHSILPSEVVLNRMLMIHVVAVHTKQHKHRPSQIRTQIIHLQRFIYI